MRAATAAAAASLMVTVEEQSEEASSAASPAAAEWKLWPELLKPLTLSPDDSELSTAGVKGQGKGLRDVSAFCLHLSKGSFENLQSGDGRLSVEEFHCSN